VFLIKLPLNYQNNTVENNEDPLRNHYSNTDFNCVDCISPQSFSLFSSKDTETLGKREGTLLSLHQRRENQGTDK